MESATAQAVAPEVSDATPGDEQPGGLKGRWKRLGTGKKVLVFLGLYGFLLLAIGLIFGVQSQEHPTFQPQDEFRLDAWVPISIFGIDMSINKAVMYLFLASALTCGTMVWIAQRMQAKPNRVQLVVELAYDLTANMITRANIGDAKLATRWFAFIGAVFFFIWFSNIIGFIPLPVNTGHPVDVFGLSVPPLALYAATANLSVPLALTLIIWFGYHIEGVRHHGPFGYVKTLVPAGISGAMAAPIFLIELLSHFLRMVSLSVRLFANMLAGHLLILIMGGGMAILIGLEVVGVATMPIAIAFFIFEIGLIASLQAFIFAILSAIYLGGAVAEDH